MTTEVADMVNHPPHYNSHPSGVECITITEHFNFLLGSAIKYIWRADDKGNPIQDLEKAVWYVQRELGRRRLLELGAEHEGEVEFTALRDFAKAGGLSNPNNRSSTAEVLREPYNWPHVEWSPPPEQLYDLYGGHGAPFPIHLPDPDDDAPDFD